MIFKKIKAMKKSSPFGCSSYVGKTSSILSTTLKTYTSRIVVLGSTLTGEAQCTLSSVQFLLYAHHHILSWNVLILQLAYIDFHDYHAKVKILNHSGYKFENKSCPVFLVAEEVEIIKRVLLKPLHNMTITIAYCPVAITFTELV